MEKWWCNFFPDNFNADGSVRQYVNPYANMPFGRFAAIDAIVAEGQWRMAAKKKENGEEQIEAAPPKPKKYNPTFDSSRIGSHPMTPDAQTSSDYKSEYSRSFSHEDRYDIAPKQTIFLLIIDR